MKLFSYFTRHHLITCTNFFLFPGIDFPTTTTDDYFREKSMHLWKNLGAGYNGTTVEVK